MIKSDHRLLTKILVFAAIGSAVWPSSAQINTWNGLGVDGKWSTPGNFVNTLAASQDLIFAGSNYLTTNTHDAASPDSFTSITFASNAGAFTLPGTAITLGAGGITNTSSRLQTFSVSQINVPASQTWDGGTAGLRVLSIVNLDLTTGSPALTVTGSGNNTILGAILEGPATPGRAGRIVKDGSGTLTFSGNNGYSGGTTLRAGTLAVGSNTALGTGGLTVQAGATLATDGRARTISNAITAEGDFSIFPKGTIISLSSFTLNGPIDLGGARVITNPSSFSGGEYGNVALGGAISNGALSLVTLPGNSAAFFSMQGAQPNTYSGATFLGTGISLRLLKSAGVTAIPGDLSIANDGVAVVDANEQIADTSAITITGIGRLQVGAGNVTTETIGSLLGDGEVELNSAAPGSTIIVGAGNFSGNITGGNATGTSLVKAGPDTLTLSGANSYAGATTIGGGTLLLNGKLTGTSAVTIAANATLGGQGTIGGPVTLQGGGTLAPAGGALQLPSLTWTAGAGVVSRLGPTSAPAQITGALTRSGAGSFPITLLDDGLVGGQTYTLATFATNAGFSLADFTTTGVPGELALTANALTFTPPVPAFYGVTVDATPGKRLATFTITNTGNTATTFLILRDVRNLPSRPSPSKPSVLVLRFTLAGRDVTLPFSRGPLRVNLAPGEKTQLVFAPKAIREIARSRVLRAEIVVRSTVSPDARGAATAVVRLPASR